MRQNEPKQSIIRYDTLAAEECSYGDNGAVFFRVVSPDDWVYDYRITDYDGGFYLFLQTAYATAKEIKRQVPFDEFKDKPKNRVLHYIRTGGTNTGGSGDVVSFVIPTYHVESITLADGVGFEVFDPMSKDNQWEQYGGMFGGSSLPWSDLPHTRLNLHAKAKADASGRREEWFERRNAESLEVANAVETTHGDMSIVEELRRRGEYDTIIHTDDGRNIYYNVDLESYEQSAAPDDFYIIYRKFYPNGRLREFRRFLPSIYGQSLPVGISSVYDEHGEMIGWNNDGYTMFLSPDFADPEFCAKLLVREGFIDLESGSGKAVMEINRHIDPHAPSHGEPRLSICAPWGMQVDDSLNSTVGLIAVRDGVETVFIINKNSHTILKKFTR